MSENIENTSLNDDNLELDLELPVENMEKAENNQERITPLNKIVSNIKTITQKIPKFVLPQIPATNVNKPMFFFPQMPKKVAGDKFSSEQFGIGSGSCNYWFFILLQLIIIMFLIKWLYCLCGRDC